MLSCTGLSGGLPPCAYQRSLSEDGIRKMIRRYFEHADWMANVTGGDYQKYYEEMYQNK